MKRTYSGDLRRTDVLTVGEKEPKKVVGKQIEVEKAIRMTMRKRIQVTERKAKQV